MCFLEFIGYTCGHISLPVLRPCPLTTASHTFPTCPRRADKPFLAGEMCPTCQKIVHSRATQIEEYEHRFMHERGACGCETIFPYLIRPRIIGGGELTASGSSHEGTAADLDTGGDGGGEMTLTGDSTCSAVNSALLAGDDDTVPPILCEAVDVAGRSVVSVRLPSLYAAEWATDHRERHGAGLCVCRVDCRTYGQASQGNTEGALEEPSVGIYLAPPAVPAHRRVMSLSSMPPDDVGELRATMRKHQRRSSHGPFSYSSGTGDHWAEFRATGVITPPADASPDAGSPDPEANTVTAAGAATLPPPDDNTPVTGYHAQPVRAGKPVRYAGAVFTKVPGYLPLTGQFLARPTPLSRDTNHMPVIDGILNAGTEKGSSVANRLQHHIGQSMDRNPLLGYPIGAGPEGVPHAAAWQGQPSCWRQT
ncbi:hypothetical protein F503_08331 [Ophiostoma piceae UAMH 11346]|uniref:Uncharacterized protein n=1 Tax=Ophiostoma piceae (strain UAMH 11346) TaxID=1262450 RepID=S3CY45_OPHP1|nr:hypothetical protein F503_08331 [Ophiostoma piceae UAMH 11346]